jgi:hypothetical protein
MSDRQSIVDKIMSQLAIDGMRRFYRAVEQVEKERNCRIDVRVDPLGLWFLPGRSCCLDPDYAVIVGSFKEAIHLDWSFRTMLCYVRRRVSEDHSLPDLPDDEDEEACETIAP